MALLSLQGLAQLEVLGLQRSEPVLPSPGCRRRRLAKGLRKLLAQTRHFPVQSGGACPDLAAELLRLFDGRVEFVTAGFEPRLPRTGIAAGGHFGPAQLFAARLRRVRPRPFPLLQPLQVVRCACRCGGGKANPLAALGQRRLCGKISVENRHAFDDSAWPDSLPAGNHILSALLHGTTESLLLRRRRPRCRARFRDYAAEQTSSPMRTGACRARRGV